MYFIGILLSKLITAGIPHHRADLAMHVACHNIGFWTVASDRVTAPLRLVPPKAAARKRPSRIQSPATAHKGGKKGRVLKLLRRPGGATLKVA